MTAAASTSRAHARRILVVFVVLSAVLVGSAVVETPTAEAAFGRLLFLQTTNNHASYTIHMSLPNGGGRHAVSNRRALGRMDWSPDGGKIVFSSPELDDSLGRYGLMTMNADGSGARWITGPRYGDFDPAWSPDGRYIAFTRDTEGTTLQSTCCSIWVARADGSGARYVSGTAGGSMPTWSPDGTKLAFAHPSGLRVVNVSGGGVRTLVSGRVRDPAWSPDGSTIAFVRELSADRSNLQLVGAGGGAARVLTDPGNQVESPEWTEDGSIYFVQYRGRGYTGRTASSIWRVDQRGSLTLMADPPGQVYFLAYSLDVALAVERGWGRWARLTDELASSATVASWGPGRRDVFAVASDGTLVQKRFEEGKGWLPEGGAVTNLGKPPGVDLVGTPSAIARFYGQLNVFVRGDDDQLWHRSYKMGSGWAAWQPLGGQLTSSPGAVTWLADKQIVVFARDPSGAITSRVYANGSWRPWQVVGGRATSAPAATSFRSGRLDLVVRGTDDALWQRIYVAGQGWSSNWIRLGGQLAGPEAPALVPNGPDRLDVVVIGTNGSIYRRWWIPGRSWVPSASSWQNLGNPGAPLESGIAAQSLSPGRLEVYMRHRNGTIWHRWQV